MLEGARFDETVSEMLYLDFRLYLEDNLLVKVDRASMACSLELRTPFLDHRLIEFAEGLPGNLKVRRFQLKYILKKAVERWLPHEIVYRQKRGFSVPIASWMRNELRPLVDETLGEEKLRRAWECSTSRSCADCSTSIGRARPITARPCGRCLVFNFGSTGGEKRRD